VFKYLSILSYYLIPYYYKFEVKFVLDLSEANGHRIYKIGKIMIY